VRFESLDAWLAWQERLNPRAIDLGLERVREVLGRLALGPVARRIVTVAGTNGKGSTVAVMEAVLQCSGYRVGTYTSPHLLRYNERVRINGTEASDEALCAAFETVEWAREATALTYFEFGTLAALTLLEQAGLDVAILEVGLGGRLDAVNCVDSDVAVVTAIGIDHTDWLGPDRDSIAREKAGILRAGRPAVCSDRQPPQALVSRAEELGARLHVLGRDFWHEDRPPSGWAWRGPGCHFDDLPPPTLAGTFQRDNAAGALMALVLIQSNVPWSTESLRQGLRTAIVPGRFQVLPGPVPRILDVAHNPQAAQALADTLRARPCAGRTFAVFSMLRDKDLEGVVRAMSGAVDAWYLAPLLAARAAPTERLAAAVARAAVPFRVFESVLDAHGGALADARPGDRVVVFGSFYVVAEVLRTAL
jgi:dihydrofolate synthase/folylpolyglutamate synthase